MNINNVSNNISFNQNISKNLSLDDYMRLNKQDKSKAYDRFVSPLSGYTRDEKPEISIWGKLMGFDKNFTTKQIRELKDFIDSSKVLGIDLKFPVSLDKATLDKNGQIVSKPYYVDEFMQKFNSISLKKLLVGETSLEIFDKNLSIDEFKQEWAIYALKERFNLVLSKDDAKNAISILDKLKEETQEYNPKEESKTNFKPIEAVSIKEALKDEATSELRELYKIIKQEFDNGKETFDILEKIAKIRINKLA
ncbi:MAG: hypothetical protein SPI03_05335 [Campylobacter sputorum]|uniref:hypothetical protein n=1 Tax=Campylobacter sputorum TaxID=206 RepID=UPI000B77F772|nr:hypothetical protein [Campylobacter sputorum]ASM38450.1 hypothetical protein CSPARA_0878 [Campylobacter sputorum bv. paraureolyticus LMG 11764]MDY6120739.1 hypothetical protein [Campylobacter sputorum]